MPVLTRADYLNRTAHPVRSVQLPPSVKVEAGVTPRPSPSRLYVLAYPEMPANGGAANFDYIESINGVKYPIRCVNNVVRTTEKDVRDNLVNKGYIELEVKEIENENQN